ncbi:Protein of unknown function [Gryllus bimaculatus]|nr:Protein of unknown function [Gryllus bimaculatus]
MDITKKGGLTKLPMSSKAINDCITTTRTDSSVDCSDGSRKDLAKLFENDYEHFQLHCQNITNKICEATTEMTDYYSAICF